VIFTSFIFLFWFLPIVLALHAAAPGRSRNLILTLFSYAFYGWWRIDFVALMLFSTAVDYLCARRMSAAGANRKRWLLGSLCTNLGLLAYFKYANLGVATLDGILAVWGQGPLPWEAIILPVGISFYTFQSMSYTIDVYRGRVEASRSFLDVACYVSLFPQLVAGPIVRFRDVQAQLRERTVDLMVLSSGVFLFMIGFAKKVLLADSVAPLADAAFGGDAVGLVGAWTGLLAYTLQIYYDFSGYSDMAIGLGLLLGFRYPRNFHSPYRSASITEFWQRWHISLSTWLRDYLYIPLGGNRRGARRTAINLMITMLLGGLWHGAAWTFVLWGAYHGGLLGAERLLGKRSLWWWSPRPVQVLGTLLLVMIGWALFRASSMAELGAMLQGLSGADGVGETLQLAAYQADAYVALAVGTVLALGCRDSWSLVRAFPPLRMVLVGGLFLVAVGRLLATEYSPFLYFQF